MKRLGILLISLATVTVAMYLALAQQPRDRGGSRVAKPAPSKSSTVTEFNRNPNGDSDGLRLEDGTEVRFPASAGENVTGAVALKDRVTIKGWTYRGESEIHATTIKNETSGKLLVVDRPPPEISSARMSETKSSSAAASPRTSDSFVLRSPEVAEGGMLPTDYTGDGSSATLPLQWSGAPAGTRSFAVIMHHLAPDGTKWYWVLYNIPAGVTSLPKNVTGIGTLGTNSVSRNLAYAPPHSKGPGPKKYTYTVYALAAAPRITVPPEEVSREVLLSAVKGSILATAELNVIYSRGKEPAEPGPRDTRN